MGDRQMLPVQTKMMRNGVDSSGVSDAKDMCPIVEQICLLHMPSIRGVCTESSREAGRPGDSATIGTDQEVSWTIWLGS